MKNARYAGQETEYGGYIKVPDPEAEKEIDEIIKTIIEQEKIHVELGNGNIKQFIWLKHNYPEISIPQTPPPARVARENEQADTMTINFYHYKKTGAYCPRRGYLYEYIGNSGFTEEKKAEIEERRDRYEAKKAYVYFLQNEVRRYENELKSAIEDLNEMEELL